MSSCASTTAARLMTPKNESGSNSTISASDREVLVHDAPAAACVSEGPRKQANVRAGEGDVSGLDRDIGSTHAHCNTDVSHGERWRVVDAVADHRDVVERLDRGDFVFGAQLGADIRDVGLGRDRVRGACVVAGQHRDPDALFLQRSHRIGRSFAELIAHTDHRGWFVVDVQNHGGHAVFFKLGGVCAERAGAEPSWASDRDAVAVDPAFDAVAGLFRDVGCGGDHGCGGGDRGGDRVGAVLFEGGGPFQGDVHADVRDGADGGDLWFAAGEGPGLVDRDVADGSEPFECCLLYTSDAADDIALV